MAPAMNPIDYYIPVVNRAVTLRAVSITCLLVALIGVALRLWTRWRVIRAFGWDDFFVTMAAICSIFGTVTLNNVLTFDTEIPHGLGLHVQTIVTEKNGEPDYSTYETYFMWFYLTNVAYAAMTTTIKLSILFQYMRLFSKQLHPRMFRVCLTLIIIVAIWGLTFICLVIFACNPVEKSWHVTMPGKCIMFGDFNPKNAFTAYASHTGSNMFLDTLILIAPIPLLARLSVSRRQRIGLIGLFSGGLTVVICASLRLWLVIKSRAGTYPTIDPPWYAPPIVIMSVLEVNLAILTASMPIFWPYLASIAAPGIKVMQEVIVRSETRKTYYTQSRTDENSLTGNAANHGGHGRRRSSGAAGLIMQRSNSDASDLRLKQSNGGDSGRSAGERSASVADQHRKYYGDPAVADLVLGDLKGSDADFGSRELFGSSERTGHQAAAWFEPVALNELEPKQRQESKV